MNQQGQRQLPLTRGCCSLAATRPIRRVDPNIQPPCVEVMHQHHWHIQQPTPGDTENLRLKFPEQRVALRDRIPILVGAVVLHPKFPARRQSCLRGASYAQFL
jgi:hypothetical protein